MMLKINRLHYILLLNDQTQTQVHSILQIVMIIAKSIETCDSLFAL